MCCHSIFVIFFLFPFILLMRALGHLFVEIPDMSLQNTALIKYLPKVELLGVMLKNYHILILNSLLSPYLISEPSKELG